MSRAVSILVIVFTLGLSVARAQSAPEKVAYAPAYAPSYAPKITLPFKVGETLTYEVNFSKLIFSGTIGELKLTVSKPANSSGTDMLELSADAVSKGFFPSLFGVKVKDRYVSLVNQTDFGVYSSTKHLDEGKNRREQKSVVDREAARVTYTDRDLTKTAIAPKVKEKPSPSWVQDLLSSIYFVRAQPLKDGDVIPLPISDGGEVYNVEVVVLKREEIKTDAGKFHAIQLSARVFDGRYIKRKGEMLVWVSDDAARIPLHARVRTSGTTITVDLKRITEGD